MFKVLNFNDFTQFKSYVLNNTDFKIVPVFGLKDTNFLDGLEIYVPGDIESSTGVITQLDPTREINKNSSTLVVFDLESDFWVFGLLYAKLKDLDYIAVNHPQQIIKEVEKTSRDYIIIVTSPMTLTHEFQKGLLEASSILINGYPRQIKSYGIFTARDLSTMSKVLLKNYYHNNSNIRKVLINTGGYEFNKINKELYKEPFQITYEDVFNKSYDVIFLSGGGREDRLKVGKIAIYGDYQSLSGDYQNTSPLPDDFNFDIKNKNKYFVSNIDTKVLAVNGCVLGKTTRSKVEYPKEIFFSYSALEGKVISYIAPYCAKGLAESEAILLYKLLLKGLPIGECVKILNQYAAHLNFFPSFVLYGDPTLTYNKESLEHIEASDTIYFNSEEDLLFVKNVGSQWDSLISQSDWSQKEDIYYLIIYNSKENKDLILFTADKLKSYKEIKLKNNYKEHFLETIRDCFNSMQKNNVYGLYPPDTKGLESQILNRIKEINEYSILLNYSSKNDGLFVQKKEDFISLVHKFHKKSLSYWEKNTITDKKRFYDKHYVQSKIKDYIMKQNCPVCNSSYYFEQTMQYASINSIHRTIEFCPTCSVITDFDDLKISIEMATYVEKGKVNYQFSIVNNTSYPAIIDCLLTWRGIKNRINNTDTTSSFILDGKMKKLISYSIKTEDLYTRDKVYPVFILMSNLKYYFLKRPHLLIY
ncbi:hypothetical protein [Thermoflavimicrobium dichotomicum]|uniref:Uncharacterized protein n=1 Tax=Thermoflavimicrobium dichotomicum TaxID=46223 RepID=A0A1I3U356_9BACL|nr:hypothetical protein [Thermoflavimicrobium dichotomicum]SFJ77420.1 hypothetical protein SAMN05421852_12147 [Thermoflavimicrobium dichotomicum]